METLTYRLDQFEGPLDLLLSLVDKNKIDISDIPIALLCDQYIAYITEAENAGIELASEFITMASELMLIKSRMLLPRTEEEAEDPRAALAAAMLEYQRAKEAAQILTTRFSEYGLRMGKDTDEIETDNTVMPHDVELLTRAYNRIISEIKLSDTSAKTHFEPIIRRETVSVGHIVSRIGSRLAAHRPIPLADCFAGASTKAECIVTFLALLELMKSELLILSEATYSETGVIDIASDVTVCLKDGTDPAELAKYVSEDE